MNPLIATALIALLQREVNLLELQLAQLQTQTAIVATTTQLKSASPSPITVPTLSYNGLTYPDTQQNMDAINAIQAEQTSCEQKEIGMQNSPGYNNGQGPQQVALVASQCAAQVSQYESQLSTPMGNGMQ